MGLIVGDVIIPSNSKSQNVTNRIVANINNENE